MAEWVASPRTQGRKQAMYDLHTPNCILFAQSRKLNIFIQSDNDLVQV